jgi:prepilin-type N-terminal cleavage/methylation domain-containing protein
VFTEDKAMNLSRRPSLARVAFTLVELLVVIAIIAVLMGLIIPAAMNILKKPNQFKTSNEIGQFQTAIQTFEAEFHVKYIPSRIKLCRKLGDYVNTPLDNDSKDYMLGLFPRCANKWATQGIDWGLPGAAYPITLEGDQCLVFFLGGKPLAGPPLCFGWSGDQQDPTNVAQTQGRKGPYFVFESDRLYDRKGTGFYSYKDFYNQNDPTRDQPYAYFSSYGNNLYSAKYGGSDCQTLGVGPYMDRTSPVSFHNPKTCQIISAGVDRMFGPGGMWTPAAAGSIDPRGKDDQTNFHPSLMGIGN